MVFQFTLWHLTLGGIERSNQGHWVFIGMCIIYKCIILDSGAVRPRGLLLLFHLIGHTKRCLQKILKLFYGSVFSSAVPPGSGAFQMPTRPSLSSSSSAASTLRGGGGGGKGQSQKRFSNFFYFCAWGFFGMTLTTYHKKDLVESL